MIGAVTNTAKILGGSIKGGLELPSELEKDGGGLGGLQKLKSALGKDPAGAVGMGMGLIQQAKGRKLRKQADAALPADEDPEMRRAQRQFARQKRAFQTGTRTAQQRRGLERAMATGAKAAMKFGVGGRAGLQKMQDMFNQSMAQLGASSLQGELGYAGMEQKALKDISQRALEIGMQRHDELSARAATQEKAGGQNRAAALARLMPVGDVSSTAPAPNYASADYTTAANEEDQNQTTG